MRVLKPTVKTVISKKPKRVLLKTPHRKIVPPAPVVKLAPRFKPEPLKVLPPELVASADDASFSTSHVAGLYNMSSNGVWEAIRDGRLKSYQSGKVLLVKKADLIEAWEKGTFPGKRGPKPEPGNKS